MLVSKCCQAGPVDSDIMICPDCKDHLGEEDIEEEDNTCPDCNGSGDYLNMMKVNSATIDPPYELCKRCGGKGYIEEE